jgi:phosphoribosylaminoimidazole-succinocarboxamide synthase
MSTLLACLQRFCTEYHMSVNVPKTKGVIYHRKGMRVEELLIDMSFDSQSIDTQSSFIYLDINVDQCTWLRKSAEQTSKAAIRALWAMIRRFQEMNILCLDTKLEFSTLCFFVQDTASCRSWSSLSALAEA